MTLYSINLRADLFRVSLHCVLQLTETDVTKCSPCTTPQGYCLARTSLFPTFTSSPLPTTANGKWAWTTNQTCRLSKSKHFLQILRASLTHVHGGVDFCNGFIVSGELVNLDAVAHELTHDLNLEFMKLGFGDCVCFRDNGNDIHLPRIG